MMKKSALLALLLTACCGAPPQPRSFTILAVNDLYRINGVADSQGGGQKGGLARLRTLRRQLEEQHPDLIFLHAGDLLNPSLLSLKYQGEQMVDVMNRLDGDDQAFDERLLVTFGNHEFDFRDPALLDERIEASQFRWLASDLTFLQDGVAVVEAENLLPSRMLESNGVRVGLFSLSTNMTTRDYVQFADRLETARRMTAELRRRGAEVVVALTHLSLSQDEELLRTLGGDGPDLHIGGHEHSRQDVTVNGRRVLKADADGVSALVVTVTLQEGGPPLVDSRFEDLAGQSPAPDPLVQQRIDWWLTKHDREYCADQKPPEAPGCLNQALGLAGVELVAEETEIRRYETNFGNWAADLARQAYPNAHAAVIGSGGLRLNENIPAGARFQRRHLAALLPFPNDLRLFKIRGETLQKVLDRSVETWTGNGWWLQVSGIAFRHDPARQRAYDLTLLTPQGPRPVGSEEEILLVANSYVADGNDGYTMLGKESQVPDAPSHNLSDLIRQALAQAGEAGISPRLEGRICNAERSGDCLAVAQ
ncbi:MAG: 5'-nucleotidase C-terminal domain-containing protein [Acidobacteriota bacterium]